MAVEGRTYQQIADELGYANRGTVYRIVQQALEQRQAEGVEALRDLEVSRLNALQRSMWERAMAGNLGAARACLRIIEQRCRLMGLLVDDRGGKATCDQPQTVVLLVGER